VSAKQGPSTGEARRSAYHREVPTQCPYCSKWHWATIDVYAVTHAFGVTAKTIAHAIKKLLAPGKRIGGKTEEQDIGEAIWSLQRWQEMRAQEKASRGAEEPALSRETAPGEEGRACPNCGRHRPGRVCRNCRCDHDAPPPGERGGEG